jgi:lipopolysaccharide transport system permease protein
MSVAATTSAVPPSRSIHASSLIWTLARTDFKLRYHGSFGGFVWALLRPLSMFVILQAVFSLIFAAEPRYRFNLLIGLFVWDFFVEASKSGLGALVQKGHLLTKTRLPTWLLVLVSSSNAVMTLAIFFATIVVALTMAGVHLSAVHVVLFASYLFLLWLLIVGFSLAASVLFARYRDLNQVWDLVLQAGFFAAPIIYPLSILPHDVHFYLYCWPPTPVIQFSRSVLLDGVVPSALAHLLLAAEAVAALGVGLLIFRRYAPQVPEHL